MSRHPFTDADAGLIWTDADAPALCLVALALDRYLPRDARGRLVENEAGESPVTWSPQTWAAEIEDDCGVGPHPRALDRLCAGLALLHSPGEFYIRPQGFLALSESLAADWFDPGLAHPPSTAELARAVVEARMIAPPGGREAFSPEVTRYAQLTAKNEGFPALPDVFRVMGMVPDPAVPAGADLSGDPDLAQAAAQSAQDLQADLDSHLAGWLADLAEYVAALPLRHSDPRPLAAELAAQAAAGAG